ncbi:MAG TPA: methyltransferase domain-containing protein [Luteibacter sp.]|jgi:SAM-dependent methyltransferase|nr:methyltransferase domain-containing protein [Luteibacter sp.]
MPNLAHDVYASAPMRALLRDEVAAMATELARCTGEHALHVAVTGKEALPPLPLLGHWASLRVRGRAITGDVRASAGSPLPFADDAFGVVLLGHALEVVRKPEQLLAEAIRVLEPGGMLAITGIHPLGAWVPWLFWRTRPPQLVWPWWLERKLAGEDVEPVSLRRVGSAWPDASAGTSGVSWFGGGYVLLARKKRVSQIPLRVRSAPAPTSLQGSLASGARRAGPH